MSLSARIMIEAPAPAEIDALYGDAFPDEPLAALVKALLELPDAVLSLTARVDGEIAGHALFTLCELENGGCAALLGPLAVRPDLQRQGVGGRLIRSGIDMLASSDASHVVVLGDPAYYGRFGFKPERDIRPAHPIPEKWADAWRSLALKDRPATGRLIPPEPWDDPALWA